MIQRLTSIPTDAEYLRAFRENNNSLISQFIRQNMDKFLAVIKKSFGITSSVTLDEIFSDTLTRVWENIQSNKLTEEKLTTSLFSYMMGVGVMVAHEHTRNKKIVYADVEASTDDASDDEYTDDEFTNQSFMRPVTSKQMWDEASWIDAVENPYDRYVKEGHTEKECIEEWNRLTEAYEKSQKSKSAHISSASEPDYRASIIKEAVDTMGGPCAPLLNLFYWEKKSWAIIAKELEYSGADSAKTQKNKCMGKLKKIVENRLKSVIL